MVRGEENRECGTAVYNEGLHPVNRKAYRGSFDDSGPINTRIGNRSPIHSPFTSIILVF